MKKVLHLVLNHLPLIFGLGFVGPLIGQLGQLWLGPTVFGAPTQACGVVLGVVWGAVADWRRSWIWVR